MRVHNLNDYIYIIGKMKNKKQIYWMHNDNKKCEIVLLYINEKYRKCGIILRYKLAIWKE
jgi:hypothetical protein